jgi:hypothetical protein
VLDTTVRKQNNVNKTWALLQTTGGTDESNDYTKKSKAIIMITHIFIVYTKNTHEQRNRNESVLIIKHAKKKNIWN